jgi:hypothetical protein
MSRDAEDYQLACCRGSPGSGFPSIRLLPCCEPARQSRRDRSCDQTGTAVLFALTAA